MKAVPDHIQEDPRRIAAQDQEAAPLQAIHPARQDLPAEDHPQEADTDNYLHVSPN